MLIKRSLAKTSNFFWSSPVTFSVPDIPKLKNTEHDIQKTYNFIDIFNINHYLYVRTVVICVTSRELHAQSSRYKTFESFKIINKYRTLLSHMRGKTVFCIEMLSLQGR